MMNSSPAAEPALEVVRDPERTAVLMDPQRRQLLEALRDRPDSASGLARRLGDSRQRLNYHLRALEEAGFVELSEERRRGNCVERVLRVVARRFVLHPATLGELAAEPEEAGDRFSATYLVALAARTIRELADLREKAAEQEKRLATAAIDTEVQLAGPAELEAFVEDLSRAVAEVVARHHDERAPSRAFRVTLGTYPSAGHPEEDRQEAHPDRSDDRDTSTRLEEDG